MSTCSLLLVGHHDRWYPTKESSEVVNPCSFKVRIREFTYIYFGKLYYMIHCDIGAMVKSLKENGCKRHVTRTIKCNVYQNVYNCQQKVINVAHRGQST